MLGPCSTVQVQMSSLTRPELRSSFASEQQLTALLSANIEGVMEAAALVESPMVALEDHKEVHSRSKHVKAEQA